MYFLDSLGYFFGLHPLSQPLPILMSKHDLLWGMGYVFLEAAKGLEGENWKGGELAAQDVNFDK